MDADFIIIRDGTASQVLAALSERPQIVRFFLKRVVKRVVFGFMHPLA